MQMTCSPYTHRDCTCKQTSANTQQETAVDMSFLGDMAASRMIQTLTRKQGCQAQSHSISSVLQKAAGRENISAVLSRHNSHALFRTFMVNSSSRSAASNSSSAACACMNSWGSP